MDNITFSLMKNTNRFEILQLIYREKDINRNSITQATGLTGAAVTKIINGLIGENFVREKSYFSPIRKRRARYLSICEGKYCVVVLYFCRDMFLTALADISGKILYTKKYSIGWEMFDHYAIKEILENVTAQITANYTCLSYVCITPGVRSMDSQISAQKTAPFFWDIKQLHDFVETTYHIPLYAENDSNAALLGELWFGSGKNSNNLVLYNIGKGIGAAACLGGRLIKGYHNSSIEIGHVTINFQGPQCECGNRGCLELYAGLDHLKGELQKFNQEHGENETIESIFLKANGGNGDCLKFVQSYASITAEGAVILADMFSPEKIIVTTNEADFIYLDPIVKAIEENVDTRIFSLRKDKIEVEASVLRENGYILGGISVAMKKFFGQE